MIKVDQLISLLNEDFKKSYPDFKGIYFHGSRLKEKEHNDSDYDLVLTFDRKIDWKFKEEVLRKIYNYEVNYDIIIDCNVCNINEIENPATFFKERVKLTGKFYVA